MPDLDWSEMEGLFCQQAPTAPASQSGVLNFRLSQDINECDKKRKEPTEVKGQYILLSFQTFIKSEPTILRYNLTYWFGNTYTVTLLFVNISDHVIRRKTKFKR